MAVNEDCQIKIAWSGDLASVHGI